MVVSPLRRSRREKKANVDPSYLYDAQNVAIRQTLLPEGMLKSSPLVWIRKLVSTPVRTLSQTLLGSTIYEDKDENSFTFASSCKADSFTANSSESTKPTIILSPPTPSPLSIPETQSFTEATSSEVPENGKVTMQELDNKNNKNAMSGITPDVKQVNGAKSKRSISKSKQKRQNKRNHKKMGSKPTYGNTDGKCMVTESSQDASTPSQSSVNIGVRPAQDLVLVMETQPEEVQDAVPTSKEGSPTTPIVIMETQELNTLHGYATPKLSPIYTTPRSLNSLLETQLSQAENYGLQTLVTSGMLPSTNATPSQEQLSRAQNLIIVTNNRITELETSNSNLKSDIAAKNAELLIKDEEITQLRENTKRQKKDRSATINISQQDSLKKQVKLLEKENKLLKD